jgi:outer membrane protein assembly factor BamB
MVGSILALGVGTAPAAPSAADQNWPQWRGPLQNGIAPHADPPTEWSETKNIKWKVKIPGEGHATPVIWENQVFVLAAIPTGKKIEPKPSENVEQNARPPGAPPAEAGQPAPGRSGPGGPGRGPGGRGGPGGGRGFGGGQKPVEVHQFVTFCLDRQTGKVLWQQTAIEEVPHEGRHGTGSFSSASAITDGKHVFAYFGSRGLHCYDMDGKLQWSQDFGDQRMFNTFGEGSSPALHGDTMVVNWDHEGDSFIIALDKNTGKTLWKKPREEKTSWSTPFFVRQGNRTEVVTSATRKVRSYDLASGDLLWETAGLGMNAIPTPVTGHGMLYAMSGYTRPALLAIRLGRTGDLTGSDAIAWSLNKSTPYVASPLLYDDLLYMFSNRNGIISCFDAKDGKPHFLEQRLEAFSDVYASPVGAAGRIYLIGRNGATVVIKKSEKLEVLATNKLDEGIDASPAVVGKELFLRGRESLYCIAEK